MKQPARLTREEWTELDFVAAWNQHGRAADAEERSKWPQRRNGR